ncbi:NAD(P)H-quinone oxidoreductase subunit 3 [Phycisphaerae bacterium RAS2]|jgi:NADH-quinone oxidoreductase subunit A|nr:NAD(P)H-quinone oxidoreductase subunit 3 [Phycisphaerae bacterium RAS2]
MTDLGYGPIAVLLTVVTVMGLVILLLTHYLPKLTRQGPRKDDSYESGMEVIGDARRRFNVRFYLVAMLFLLFDVEIIFMYPWAVTVTNARAAGAPQAEFSFLFGAMIVFFLILLVGYVYAWGKGIFRYD